MDDTELDIYTMRVLHIRFFEYWESLLPRDSQYVCDSRMSLLEQSVAMKNWTYNIAEYLVKFPNGKVDFKWQ